MTVATVPTETALEVEPPESTIALTPAQQSYELVRQQAWAMAKSDLLPKEFKGNLPNCIIAFNLAQRMGADPFMVIQNLFVIHGKPSFSAQFLIAGFNKCGRFKPITYRLSGEDLERECVALSADLATGEAIEGPPVTLKMAQAEQWSTKAGSKWKTMPDLMLRYRAAAFLIRTTAPEITMGLQTSEELHDIAPVPRSERESAVSAMEAIENARVVNPEPEEHVDTETGEVTTIGQDEPGPDVELPWQEE